MNNVFDQQIKETISLLKRQCLYSTDPPKLTEESIDNINVALRFLYDDDSIDVREINYHSMITVKMKKYYEDILIGLTVDEADEIIMNDGFDSQRLEKNYCIMNLFVWGRISYIHEDGIVVKIESLEL
jgi:hypothetical protein